MFDGRNLSGSLELLCDKVTTRSWMRGNLGSEGFRFVCSEGRERRAVREQTGRHYGMCVISTSPPASESSFRLDAWVPQVTRYLFT